ncbi:hypothetical protein DSC47_00800 [Elizabethkingia miricola]|jgi:hypothetical protein|uniref:Uncharacterized protein n=1 Tax=Flavobacterium hydrocarbonoxydans TaxID=2683249 RepID=A0A6I4NKD7_9FLAO|nr:MULTISPECIES: hypothetical protein [Bacteroidota]RBI93474.1 hypothetical protein DSC47_00800 [Elizabethkingia miricola]HNP68076.1 hypothetical protein [Aequorivita sp.]MCW2258664.1 hypothetical protein [Sphingobacterium kitahiroshimense]MWB94956.1 hypothetical protein [Flavobacterium hydrocarbonoxydans]TCR14880.1 hypothetical protein EDF67_101987 [Sphingobacterium sp. JUb78]
MNYATQHHIGNYQHTRTETTTAIAPTVGRVCQLDAKTKGCKPSAERQAEVRTDSNATNGILKCTFLPKLKTAKSVQACQKTERDFHKSLSKLAEHHSIEPMQTQDFEFPYNIVLSMWDMETKVKRTNINWEGFKLIQDSKKTYFTSEERYNTGTTLYYIPVVPLFQILKDQKRKKTAQLLLSVCSYLYHIAQIPYYRQEESYLYWLYEMMNDWVEQDEETAETETNKRELRNAEYIGDKVEQKLFNLINLKVFEKRLNRFKSVDTFDSECWKIARNAFALYTEYPSENIFRNATLPEKDPYDNDENEIIGMEKYISFIADTKGWLYESLSDTINNEFNEYGAMEEPTISKQFDGSEIPTANLDFENRLFDLLNDLSGLLYEYKTIEK